MKAQTIGYWITTGLVALVFTFGGVNDLLHTPAVVEGMKHLGYPSHFATLIGVWKVLGVLAILAPRFPLLKEWTYAGMFFDLSGAAVAHASMGDDFGKVITPVIIGVLLVASWLLRPSSRRLPGTQTALAAPASQPAVSHA